MWHKWLFLFYINYIPVPLGQNHRSHCKDVNSLWQRSSTKISRPNHFCHRYSRELGLIKLNRRMKWNVNSTKSTGNYIKLKFKENRNTLSYYISWLFSFLCSLLQAAASSHGPLSPHSPFSWPSEWVTSSSAPCSRPSCESVTASTEEPASMTVLLKTTVREGFRCIFHIFLSAATVCWSDKISLFLVAGS